MRVRSLRRESYCPGPGRQTDDPADSNGVKSTVATVSCTNTSIWTELRKIHGLWRVYGYITRLVYSVRGSETRYQSGKT